MWHLDCLQDQQAPCFFMESLTAEAHRVGTLYQTILECVFVCFLEMLWKRNWSCLPVTGQSIYFPLACGCLHSGGERGECAVPTAGWEGREAGEYNGDCRGGWLQALISQPHGQTGPCMRYLFCLVFCSSALFQSHGSIGRFQHQKRQDPKILCTRNAAAPWHCLDMSWLLWSLEAGANTKCILPLKSLTACAAKLNAGLQYWQQTQGFPRASQDAQAKRALRGGADTFLLEHHCLTGEVAVGKRHRHLAQAAGLMPQRPEFLV